MKIFISIASYQDLLLPITINSAYTNAKFKENLRFGIIDQCKVKLDFSKAIDNDLLTDYKVVVVGVDKEEGSLDSADDAVA